MKKISRILGLDPGYGRLGFGVIELEKGIPVCLDVGVITTPAHTAFPERLLMLGTDIEQLLKEHAPDLVALESLFFKQNRTTGLKVAEVRGVIQFLCATRGIPVVEYAPATVKSTIAGSGRADKAGIQRMVKLTLHLARIPRPDDAADALAIALTAGFLSKTLS